MKEKIPLLQTKDITIGYKRNTNHVKVIAGPLQMEIFPGQLICLLGPNGAGKSTLLRTLAGLQPSISGQIDINSKRLERLSSIEKAKNISVVLTGSNRPANVNVYSLISLGRYPHTGWQGKLTSQDRKIIDKAIEATDTKKFLQCKIDELSDGEAQKVMVARALAQDTPLIILDEPTAHLDLPSRIELMRMLHHLSIESNKGILISTHDLDLALQVSDKIWILKADGKLFSGVTEDMVLNGTFETAFEREGFQFDKTTGTFNIHEPEGENIYLNGDGAPAFWTKRALQRLQFKVDRNLPAKYTINLNEENSRTKWVLDENGIRETHHSIESLLQSLSGKTNSSNI